MPRHAAAVLHGLFVGPRLGAGLALLLRHRVPAPLQVPGFRVVGAQVARPIQIIAADARDDVILDHERRHGSVVKLVEIAIGLVPALLSVLDVQRHEVAVGSKEIEPVAIHRHAAIADVDAAFGLPCEVPQLPAGARVDSPYMIRRREVEDAVDLERRGLDTAHAGPVNPRERQGVDVGRVDLVERAESPPRIIAVIHRPGVGRRLHKLGGIEAFLPAGAPRPPVARKQEFEGSFQGHQVSHDVVHVFVGVLLDQFVVRRIGIVLDDL